MRRIAAVVAALCLVFFPRVAEALPTYCSAYNGGGVATSYCGGGLGRHRVLAVDNVGRVRYGPWVRPGLKSIVFPAYGYRFVSARYQVSA
jgi:hypothetical protein